ncbi:hypothetical protein [Leadbettera azotonutricia]|uniref:Guanylate cyclase domain-containing protein n=1 Tax=Leadbettera azotonutricia (strain ATCC BAA-888 / DSM 13862 / ZAS-9) TaxID=545695 RepID=F5Y948_LEAAZ|nr:hypothetical protein [Leadbettera azotonutricia]AEF83472.1 hypothetical protein TREAZ_3272 [Leadbettera azotonutricia ZAS-9]
MNSLAEFTDTTSEDELFSFLYDKVINKEITVFSGLKEFAAPVLRSSRTHPVMMRLFELIKKLNWGFFSDIHFDTHKRLWRELVIPDKQFPQAGDLKTTLQISNLYIAMLDIHGYTQFCMDSRKNLSMMHTFDHAMESVGNRISTKCQAVSHRERGDEMVVIAASATDALTVTLSIIDYFGKTNVVDDPNIPTRREGEAEAALPVFKISAGITGGNTQSPLIITEKGNLAGFLLNSGARLQTRANELSPKESRIMVAKQVVMNYIKENEKEKCAIFRHNAVYFLETGQIEFKGVMIPTCEAVFRPEDLYKEKFSEELQRLFGSIGNNLWEQRIFLDLMEVLSKAAQSMPKFNLTPAKPIYGMQTITNDSLIQLFRMTTKAYLQDEDYAGAVELLKTLISLIEQLPQFERLLLDYLRGVTDKYDMLLKSYLDTIDREIDARAPQIFQGNYLKAWGAAKNAVNVYEKLKAIGRKSPEVPKKKALWYNLIKQNAEQMEFVLHSGKK